MQHLHVSSPPARRALPFPDGKQNPPKIETLESQVMTRQKEEARREAGLKGLYRSELEHDACGVGAVVNIKGRASHKVIEDALLILHNLDHRGAVGADPLCGDGAGILIQIPDAFYREEMRAQGVELPAVGDYGVGMIFLPQEAASRAACEQELERSVRREGQVVLGWRDVPVCEVMTMSPTVKASAPVIRQIFIGRGPDVMVQTALERKLYVIRKTAKSTRSAATTSGCAPASRSGSRPCSAATSASSPRSSTTASPTRRALTTPSS